MKEVLVTFKSFQPGSKELKTYRAKRHVKQLEDAVPVEMGNLIAQVIAKGNLKFHGSDDSIIVTDPNQQDTLFYDFQAKELENKESK